MSDPELEQRAADFWAGTELADAYPRPIEQAIALKLPVTVVKLPVVTVQDVGRWLQRRHHCPTFPSYPCDLRGCLYADRGHGFIFVCGADEAEEQRFTLAHDTAHFLVDYWWPRQQVVQALDVSIIDVLDGCRPARPEERAAAILAHVRLGPHWHLLPRRNADFRGDVHIAVVEDRADELGLELVAPRQRVLQELGAVPAGQRADAAAVCVVLGSSFGLPPYVFRALVTASLPRRPPSLLDEARRALGR
jgi:hypothetical protein